MHKLYIMKESRSNKLLCDLRGMIHRASLCNCFHLFHVIRGLNPHWQVYSLVVEWFGWTAVSLEIALSYESNILAISGITFSSHYPKFDSYNFLELNNDLLKGTKITVRHQVYLDGW